MIPDEELDGPTSATDPAHENLRALAAAATPGRWEAVLDDHGQHGQIFSVWAADAGCYITQRVMTWGGDAEFIAAANPAAILTLLAERDALAEQVARAERERDEAREEAWHDHQLRDAAQIARDDAWAERYKARVALACAKRRDAELRSDIVMCTGSEQAHG